MVNNTVIPLPDSMRSHTGFRSAYLILTPDHSNGKPDRWNGVSPNFVAFLLVLIGFTAEVVVRDRTGVEPCEVVCNVEIR